MPAIQSPCPGCQQALHRMVLEGHYGKRVEIDLCPSCHLVWFDPFESVRLSGLGWLQLLRRMIEQPASSAVLPTAMACVRCRSHLAPVRNQTRFGRTAALECRVGHGQLQTFVHLLAERGLLRAVLPSDRSVLARQGRALTCLQCGAGEHAAGAEQCAHCSSPLLMVDIPRLASALLVRHGEKVVAASAATPVTLACQGCGQPLDPAGQAHCQRCSHTVVWTELGSVRPLLDAVEPLLQTPARKPLGPWTGRRPGDYRATQFHRTLNLFKSAMGNDETSTEGGWHQNLSLAGFCRLLVLLLLLWLLFGGRR